MARTHRKVAVVEVPSGSMSGAQVVRMLRREAHRRGIRLAVLVRQLSNYPWTWLRQVEGAERVTAETVERVRALLAGEPVPIASASLIERKPRPRSVQSLTDDPAMPQERPLPRVTCFNCGATSMAPCDHLRRSGWVE